MCVLDGKMGKECVLLVYFMVIFWEYFIVVDLEGDNNVELIVVVNDFDC